MNEEQAFSISPAGESSPDRPFTRGTLLERVGSISVPVSVQLCQRRMTLGEFLGLRPGSFIPFSTRCDEPLKLRVDGSTIARGEPVQNGSQLGLRLSRFVEESPRR